MSIKKNKSNTGAATGILSGLKVNQHEVVETDQNVKTDKNIETLKSEGSSEIAITENMDTNQDELLTKPEDNSNTNLFELAKDLIDADEELVRRTFTIESLVNTQLNELKVYIMPAVTGKKKWGYNDIVNLALKEFYAKQKQILKDKVYGK